MNFMLTVIVQYIINLTISYMTGQFHSTFIIYIRKENCMCVYFVASNNMLCHVVCSASEGIYYVVIHIQ